VKRVTVFPEHYLGANEGNVLLSISIYVHLFRSL
jgi:hypothetical protein